MSKILPILGLTARVIAILLLIAIILGIAYSTYYFLAPQSMARPINIEGVSRTMLLWMLPMQRANPPQTVSQPEAPAAAPAQAGPAPAGATAFPPQTDPAPPPAPAAGGTPTAPA
jgi:hypothetical protein